MSFATDLRFMFFLHQLGTQNSIHFCNMELCKHINIKKMLSNLISEISDEQQAQINEFMATKDRKRRPNQRVRPFQQYRQMHPSRIQTITSTHMHHQPSPPPIMHPPPPVFAAPPQPRPKIHVNPAFYHRGMRPQSTSMTSVHNQPLMFDSPPRSQPPLFHHEPPPARHFDERIPPLVGYCLAFRHIDIVSDQSS